MNQAMQIVGYVNSWTQPISTRVMMQDTGIQTPVGIKVKGNDLAVVEEIAQNVETLLQGRSRHAVGHRRADLAGLLRRRAARSRAHGGARRDRRRGDADRAVRHRRRQRRSASGSRTRRSCRWPIQYSPEYIDTLDKVRNTPVVTGRRPIGAARRDRRRGRARSAGDDPQRQRRAGRLHLRLPRRHHRARVRGAGAGVSADEADDAAGLLARMDRALSVRRGCARRSCGSSCRSRW